MRLHRVVLIVPVLLAGCSAAPRTPPAAAPSERAQPSGIHTFRSVREPLDAPPPVRLRIPAIGVDTPLERLGQNPDRTVQVPRDWWRAGWYADGPAPGEPGAAVLLGHVDSPSGPAVFTRLPSLRRGARIEVQRRGGRTVVFRVTGLRVYPRRDFPVEQVYWPTLRPELRLITCTGAYDRARGGYQDNVVVFARAVGSRRLP